MDGGFDGFFRCRSSGFKNSFSSGRDVLIMEENGGSVWVCSEGGPHANSSVRLSRGRRGREVEEGQFLCSGEKYRPRSRTAEQLTGE